LQCEEAETRSRPKTPINIPELPTLRSVSEYSPMKVGIVEKTYTRKRKQVNIPSPTSSSGSTEIFLSEAVEFPTPSKEKKKKKPPRSASRRKF